MRQLIALLIPAVLAAQTVVTPIDWAALPAPVQAAAKKQKTPAGAKVVYVKLVRSGTLFYEMKIDAADGRDQEILFRPDGVVAETEEAVSIQSIPAPARAAIQKEAGNRKIVKIDLLIRDGKTYYEGEYLENGVKKKALFDPGGKRVE